MFSNIRNLRRIIGHRLCSTSPEEVVCGMTWEKFTALPYRKALNIYFGGHPHIEEIRHIIPQRYVQQKQRYVPDILYLVDSKIAEDIAKRILPFIKTKNHMVCETNPGLGFVTSVLLDNGLERIRLYESCAEFRATLKGFSDAYPSRVELFVKDLFHIWKMSLMDKLDRGLRVAQFLRGVPTRDWSDEPVMTIIGPMSKLDFLSYVFKMISLQSEIATHGRIECFVIMRPGDYIKLTAGPQCNLHTYQTIAIFADTFCKITLIEKYPRIAFLPWERFRTPSAQTRYIHKHDVDKLYLVRIEFKGDLSIRTEQLLPFYFFVRQIFGSGNKRVIERLENWIMGIGKDILLPKTPQKLFEDIDIFTRTGQLTPPAYVELFKVLYDNPAYTNSTLTATVDSELLKFETVDTDTAEVAEVTRTVQSSTS